MDEFKNIEIKNFKGIDHMRIDDFSRINVFVRQNNSGGARGVETITVLMSMSKPDTTQIMKLIKDANRNYENSQHRNLDTEYPEPLNDFLKDNISE